MALSDSFVGGKVAVFAGTTSTTNIVLTDLTGGLASAPAAGDIVIVAYAVGAAADRTIGVTTADYTEEQELYANGTSYDSNLSVSWKKMGGTPDTSVTVSGTGSNFNAGAVAIHVWRGQDAVTPFDVAETTATGTGTGRPNPAAITPTTSGAVVIVAGAAAAVTGAAFTASELSNFFTDTSPDNEDAMVGLGSYAWTSGAFDPAAWTGGTTNAGDSWTAVTLALRPAATQALTPTLFTNTQTFHAPTVAATYSLTPALFTNTQTFHAPTVSATYPLTPDLFTNSASFYSATVSQSSGYELTPDLFTNTQTFYGPTVSATYALTPGLFTDAQTFYGPTVTAAYALTPDLFTNTQTFYSATVSPGAVDLAPPLLTNSPTFYSPTVTPGAVTLTPSIFTNTQTFYSADLAQIAPPETSPERILTLYGHSRTITVPRISIRSLRPTPLGRRLLVTQLVRTVVCDATPPRLLAVPRDNPRQVIV